MLMLINDSMLIRNLKLLTGHKSHLKTRIITQL